MLSMDLSEKKMSVPLQCISGRVQRADISQDQYGRHQTVLSFGSSSIQRSGGRPPHLLESDELNLAGLKVWPTPGIISTWTLDNLEDTTGRLESHHARHGAANGSKDS